MERKARKNEETEKKLEERIADLPDYVSKEEIAEMAQIYCKDWNINPWVGVQTDQYNRLIFNYGVN